MINNSLLLGRFSPGPDSEQSSRGGRTQRSLMAVKRGRKQAEGEAVALANRIALLQKEEAKIWSNVEQAKMRSKEAYISQRRNGESTVLVSISSVSIFIFF